MKGLLEKEPRNVIPRWRRFAVASQTDAQLASSRPRHVEPDDTKGDEDYQKAVDEFTNGQSVWDAGDVLAMAVSRKDDVVARKVATFIESQRDVASPLLADLAYEYLNRSRTNGAEQQSDRGQIRQLRHLLQLFPKNAVAWTDLALYLTIAGSFQNARKAIRTALHLAPNNRFVLRSASRFFIHEGELDAAHDLLARAESTQYDPWLLAAEVASARAAGTRSSFTKRAHSMLEDHNLHPQHISELASALATTEGDAPTARRLQIRRLIAKSLIDPTENSVAQAQWHATNTGFANALSDHANGRDLLEGRRVYEAHAFQSYIEGDFNTSFDRAKQWFADQPFSARPAYLAAQVATTLLSRPHEAIDITLRALTPNPGELMLWNNLAYAYALVGEIEKAKDAIDRIDETRLETKQRITVTATHGAIEFRSGKIEEGRRLYMKAVNDLEAADLADQDLGLIALAVAHHAYEEAAAETSEAVVIYGAAEKLARKVRRSDVSAIVGSIGKALSAGTASGSPERTVTVRFGDRRDKG